MRHLTVNLNSDVQYIQKHVQERHYSFFIQRILIFRVRRDGYFHWFSSTIIQERPECFLKRLFSVFLFSLQFVCLFLIIIPQSTTQGSRPEKVKFFFLAFLNQFLTSFFQTRQIISLAVQRGQRQGYQTKCFLFFLVNFLCFSDFFVLFVFYNFFTSVCRRSRWVHGSNPRPSLICGPLECGLLSAT